jgi:hypothetical protein
VWQCPVCSDNGLIHGWEDTLWNGPPDRHPGSTNSAGCGPPVNPISCAARRLIALSSSVYPVCSVARSNDK